MNLDPTGTARSFMGPGGSSFDAYLRLWLYQFVQENDITFEELFPPEVD